MHCLFRRCGRSLLLKSPVTTEENIKPPVYAVTFQYNAPSCLRFWDTAKKGLPRELGAEHVVIQWMSLRWRE